MQRDAFGGTRPDAGQFGEGGGQAEMDSGSEAIIVHRSRSRPSGPIYDYEDDDENRELHPIPGRLKPAVILPISELEMSLAWPSA